MRKLLFLITEDWYFVGHRLALALAAKQAGYDVGVAARVNAHADVIRDAGLTLHPVDISRSSLSPVKAARETSAIARIYRAVRPDVVHHIAMKPVVLGSAAARSSGAPGVVNSIVGFGYAFASHDLKARLARPAIRMALRRALAAPHTRVTVENGDDFTQMVADGLADPGQVRLTPGVGIDVARFDIRPPPSGPPLIVLPARLLAYKGVAEFVGAARILKAQGVEARFALVGAPDASNPASVTPADLDVWRKEAAVELWGWRTEMREVLCQASIVCLPSHYREGLPVSLLEAAAARRAIVTTDMPGCRDVVNGGACGWIVPPRDVAALAGALRDAIETPAKRDAFAALAHARAVQLYDSSVIHRQMLAIYDEVLASAS